jgi:probable HAF family extracellular repeat protein
MTSLLTRLLLLFSALAFPLSIAAQDKQNHGSVRYSLRVLGTLGGGFGEAHGLNNKGSTAGRSLVTGDSDLHAFFWRKGVITDLGTLGGPHSFVPLANHTVSENDWVVGFSQTSTPDPNAENFCSSFPLFANGLICLPFVWENGVMTALPTLGGNNGQALGINNRGQIVGLAETPNLDPCSPFAQQVEPVIWEHGVVQEILQPFGGTAAVANAINDNGDVVGLSGCAATGNVYAVLWQHGTPINLGSLGGVFGNIPDDINNRGQVVGQSDLPGDTRLHAFLWQDGVMTDLGSLSDALPTSEAIGINNQGQIVGFSQDPAGDDDSSVAVVWENGTITDLNTVIPAGSPLFLMEALAINDGGEIAGFGRLANGEHRGFLLTPCHAAGASANDCEENSK